MNLILLAALAASTPQAPAPDRTDLRCYRLMADLARAEDQAVRMLGLSAAHFFLGRIDVAASDYDLTTVPAIAEAERPALLRQCSDALGESGFDLRSVALDAPEPTA